LSTAAVQAVYWTVTALMGVSLSLLLFRYTGASVARTFFVTAAAFGALSLYGYTTKRDLTAMGQVPVHGAVIGLLLAGIVNMIWPSGTMRLHHLRRGRADLLGPDRLRHPEDQGTVLLRGLGYGHGREGRYLSALSACTWTS
jgi:hypothetical protein